MPRYEFEDKIVILSVERPIEAILSTLIYYPGDKVTQFFEEIGLNFPRELRISVLRDVLRTKVLKTRDERASLADEMNYRLTWFNQFSELQLVNLYGFYNDVDLEKTFLQRFWLNIIEYITDKKIAETDFNSLIEKSIEYSKLNGLLQPDFKEYNNQMNPLFFDQKGKIDGLKPDSLRAVLYKSSTITEIRELGEKYDVKVPRRLKKSELIEIVVKELKERNEYKEEIESQLNDMNILLIQRFAVANKIKASTELKKEEVIEYILSNARETRETYFAPSSSVYHIEAAEVAHNELNDKPIIIEEIKVVEEEIINKELDEVIEVRKVIEEEKVIEKNDEVKETYINTVRIKEEKPVIKKENKEKPIVREENKEKKKAGLGKKLLKIGIIILSILVVLILAIIIIILLTPNGAPKWFKEIEDLINRFLWSDFIKNLRKYL